LNIFCLGVSNIRTPKVQKTAAAFWLLGHLAWGEGPSRAYNVEITKDDLRMCIDEIKVIHEDITDARDADFAQAKNLLHKAERIVFIGFGYSRRNIERSGVTALTNKMIVGSCVGLGSQARG
jgi:hypothetical protein